MTNPTALAVRTARRGRPELDNHFEKRRHVQVFEEVRLGRQDHGPIQKIMSAPIIADDKVIGVVHVSRKGAAPVVAGPNFTEREFEELAAIAALLGGCLKLVAHQ